MNTPRTMKLIGGLLLFLGFIALLVQAKLVAKLVFDVLGGEWVSHTSLF